MKPPVPFDLPQKKNSETKVNDERGHIFSRFCIRLVTQSDLPKLEWEGEYWKFREMFAELFQLSQTGQCLLWIIEAPETGIIGQAFVMLTSIERKFADGLERAYVFSFRVKEPWRNQGVGSFLMRFIEDDLRQRRFKVVTLNVAKINRDALRLYKRLGYQVFDTSHGLWSYRDPDGVVHHMHEPSWRMMKNI